MNCQGGCCVNSFATPICHHLAFWTVQVALAAFKFSDSPAGIGAIQVHTLGISHCSAIVLAPWLSPLLSAENFLSSLSAAAAKPAGRPSCLQHVLSLGRALIPDTHRCSVPFPGPSVTLWTWSRPDPGLVERPTAPRFLLQRSKPTAMGNHSDKKQGRAKPTMRTIFLQAASSSSTVPFHLAFNPR